MKPNTKKIVSIFVATLLLAPLLYFASARQASAAAGVADTNVIIWDFPELLWNKLPEIAWAALENAGYIGLKQISHQIAELGANSIFGEFATGGKGQLPTFETLDWKQFGINAGEAAIGGAMDGLVLGAEMVLRRENNYRKYGGSGKDVETIEGDQASNMNKLLNIDDVLTNYSSQLKDVDRDWAGYDCDRLTDENDGDCNFFKIQKDHIKGQIQSLGEGRKLLNQSIALRQKSLDNIEALDDQMGAQEFERFTKYQKNQAGAFSPAALSFLKGVCNPQLDLIFKIGLGLGAGIGDVPKPICEFNKLTKNWQTFIQTKAAVFGSLDNINGWKLAAELIDPYKSDIGISFGIQSSILQDVIDERMEAEKEKWKNELAASGLKGVADFAGHVLTPSGLSRDIAVSALGEEVIKKQPLTGKLVADTADIIIDFIGTFAGKAVRLGFQGIRRLATETNQDGRAGGELPGQEGFSSGPLYQRAAAASYGGSTGPTVSRIAQLMKVKTSSGEILNTLSEFQISTDCTISPNACVLGNAFANAIREKMTVDQALRAYRETGGTKGLNPDGRFGFLNKKDDQTPNQPDFRDHYPYSSMVILRKYRVLPVAWELAALYIRDHRNSCGQKNCTLQDLVNAYDNKDSVFYRLIDPQWLLKIPSVRCQLKGYGPAYEKVDPQSQCVDTNNDGKQCCDGVNASCTTQEAKDKKVEITARPEVCVDERTCLQEGPDGRCLTPDAGENYGYCLEERKKFHFPGTQCRQVYDSCETFREQARIGATGNTTAGKSISLLKSSINGFLEPGTAENICKKENAGCSWLSTQRRQYESCVIDIELDTEGKPKTDGDQVLTENKTGKELSRAKRTNDEVPSYGEWDGNIDTQQALCQKITNKLDKEKTQTITREWLDNQSKRVFLTSSAPSCEAAAEGCRAFTDGTNLRLAPSYLKCDESEAFLRSECQRYALHCRPEHVGCDLYRSHDQNDPNVSAVGPTSCREECVGIKSYFLQPSFFDPDPPADSRLTYFKSAEVARCSAQEAGCEEFTNIDIEGRRGEERAYFTKAISCELVQEAQNRTVFYSYYGSEQGGRQPVAFYLKADDSGNPACAPNTNCACDSATFAEQVNNPTQPITCREFISAQGAVSYRFTDKVIYQTADCSEYRRTADNSAGHYISKSLSAQCESKALGCRAYASTTAGNYALTLRDTFDEEPFTAGWIAPADRPDLTVDTSREAETVGGRSLRVTTSRDEPNVTLGIEKDIVLSAANNYRLSFNVFAPKRVSVSIISKRQDEPGLVLADASSIPSVSGWQYFSFTIENRDVTRLLISIIPQNQEILSQVFIDNIYLKESPGTTVYAIDTTTKTQEARPDACLLPGSDSGYETNCRLYTAANNETPQAYSNFTTLCPLPFVGCRAIERELPAAHSEIPVTGTETITGRKDLIFVSGQGNLDEAATEGGTKFTTELSVGDKIILGNETRTVASIMSDAELTVSSPWSQDHNNEPFQILRLERARETEYLVDAPKARCQSDEVGCTGYGFPKRTREVIATSALAPIRISERVASTSTANKGSREEWATLYYKISPEEISASSTLLTDRDSGNVAQAYNAGMCKEQESGCKEYNSSSAVRYFKDPGKNVCSFGAVAQSAGTAHETEIWHYKACRKKNPDDLEKDPENELKNPSYACQTDADCEGLSNDVYTGTCDAQISCGIATATNNNGGDTRHACQTDADCDLFDARVYTGKCVDTPSSSTGSRGKSCQVIAEKGGGGPAGYTDAFDNYVELDIWNTYRAPSYARACPANASGCREIRDPECQPCGPQNGLCPNGDPNGYNGVYRTEYGRYEAESKYKGTACTTKYFYLANALESTKECSGQIDPEKGCILFYSNDIGASESLYPSAYYYNQYFTSKRPVTINQADKDRDEVVNADPIIPIDANVLLKTRLDRECKTWLECSNEDLTEGKDRAICVQRMPCSQKDENGECSSVIFSLPKVCSGNHNQTCSQNGDCANLGPCIDLPGNPDCDEKTSQSSCQEEVRCAWLSSGVCVDQEAPSLQASFKSPYKQRKEYAGVGEIPISGLDMSFAMLSGLSRPNMVFNNSSNQEYTPTPWGHDGFFSWVQLEGHPPPAPTPPTTLNESTQNKLAIQSEAAAIVNSCRLYPRSDSPHIVYESNNNPLLNNACEYEFSLQKNIGLYGYCIEPYPSRSTQEKDLQRAYDINKKGWVCSEKTDKACVHGSTLQVEGQPPLPRCDESEGDCIYSYGYHNACLVWHPIDKTSNQPLSGAQAGKKITAYGNDITPPNEKKIPVYYCVAESSEQSGSEYTISTNQTGPVRQYYTMTDGNPARPKLRNNNTDEYGSYITLTEQNNFTNRVTDIFSNRDSNAINSSQVTRINLLPNWYTPPTQNFLVIRTDGTKITKVPTRAVVPNNYKIPWEHIEKIEYKIDFATGNYMRKNWDNSNPHDGGLWGLDSSSVQGRFRKGEYGYVKNENPSNTNFGRYDSNRGFAFASWVNFKNAEAGDDSTYVPAVYSTCKMNNTECNFSAFDAWHDAPEIIEMKNCYNLSDDNAACLGGRNRNDLRAEIWNHNDIYHIPFNKTDSTGEECGTENSQERGWVVIVAVKEQGTDGIDYLKGWETKACVDDYVQLGVGQNVFDTDNNFIGITPTIYFKNYSANLQYVAKDHYKYCKDFIETVTPAGAAVGSYQTIRNGSPGNSYQGVLPDTSYIPLNSSLETEYYHYDWTDRPDVKLKNTGLNDGSDNKDNRIVDSGSTKGSFQSFNVEGKIAFTNQSQTLDIVSSNDAPTFIGHTEFVKAFTHYRYYSSGAKYANTFNDSFINAILTEKEKRRTYDKNYISSANKVPCTPTENDSCDTPTYRKGSPNTFGFIPGRLWQKVSIQFYVNINPEQLPMRELVIDWGDGKSQQINVVSKAEEGFGYEPRDGLSESNHVTTESPYKFAHIYQSSPVGRTICVFSMDNWEAKVKLCGEIEKVDNLLTIRTFTPTEKEEANL